MHCSHALSKSHTQPILIPRTPPWRKGPHVRRKACLQPSDSLFSASMGAGGHDKWTSSDFLSLSGWRPEAGRKEGGLLHVA